MTGFDTVIVIDWSGGNDRGPTPKADAIWACVAREGRTQRPLYMRNRQVAEAWLQDILRAEREAGRRVFVGLDFPFGYPAGFAEALCGRADPLAVWDWLAERITDTPKANNRFDVAGKINALFGGRGPFWGNALRRDIAGLPRTKADYVSPFAAHRKAEAQHKGKLVSKFNLVFRWMNVPGRDDVPSYGVFHMIMSHEEVPYVNRKIPCQS